MDTHINIEFRLEQTELVKSRNLSIGIIKLLQKQKYQIEALNEMAFSITSIGEKTTIFFILNNTKVNIKSEQLIGTPLSTQAELIAILMVLTLVAPEIKIHWITDSEAAMTMIKGYINTSIYRKINKYQQVLTLQAIKEIIKTRNLTLLVYKIEMHSNNE